MTNTAQHSGLILDSRMMADLAITDMRTLNRMVETGDLPERSFAHGWHVKVLEKFYLERLERQQGPQ